MERMDSREEKIKEMIEERKQQLAAHESGNTLLDAEVSTRRSHLTYNLLITLLFYILFHVEPCKSKTSNRKLW